ncbi:MAG: hypothetical protein Kow0079_15380 [Vicingaceae bacterium]
MEALKSQVTVVAKEDISSFKFPKEEVLKEKELKGLRTINIRHGLTLGNLDKRKVKIIFEDDQGIKKVETTIWGITEENIILKKGILIPICRVHDVKFY